VSRVLLSPECQRINFRWGKQHINAKAYRTVVFALVDSRIHLYEADDADPEPSTHYSRNRPWQSQRSPRAHLIARSKPRAACTHAVPGMSLKRRLDNVGNRPLLAGALNIGRS
jgi:hypothetical protein